MEPKPSSSAPRWTVVASIVLVAGAALVAVIASGAANAQPEQAQAIEVTISGSAVVGSTLTASSSGLTAPVAYDWFRCDAAGNPAGCITQDTLNNQVFCSCRCSVGADGQANTPLCACGDGFTCLDDVVTTGGVGVTGGYCIPCIRDGDDRNLDPTVYEDCPTP